MITVRLMNSLIKTDLKISANFLRSSIRLEKQWCNKN